MQRTAIRRCASTATGFDLRQARQLLSKFPGGTVDVAKDEATKLATVTINRPDKRNAISGQILLGLEAAAEELAAWPDAKGFLLHGQGGFFCSGGDLAMSQGTSTEAEGQLLARFANQTFSRLRQLPLMSAAFIEGAALGGGAEICVATCDWRLLAPGGRVAFVHVRMGVYPGWGGAEALRTLVGPSRALELMASGRFVEAAEAERIGLATDQVADLPAALAWLHERTQGAPQVVRTIKQAALAACPEADVQHCAKLWAGPAKKEKLQNKVKHK